MTRPLIRAALAVASVLNWAVPDARADLLVSDISGGVLRYDLATGAFLGSFISPPITSPGGLTFGPDGNLYVRRGGVNRVERYDGTTGALLGTFASGGGLLAPAGLD